MARAKKPGISAWLITWEHAGEHARPRVKVAAILDPRLPGHRVRAIVELLHVNEAYTYRERIGYANRKTFNPYPAELGSLDGAPWEGQITCGHNPYLLARLVDDLHVEGADPDSKKLIWTERPKPRRRLKGSVVAYGLILPEAHR